MQLLLTEKVTFGSPVVVSVDGHSSGAHMVQNITVPSLEEGKVKCCSVSKDMLNYQPQISLNVHLSFYSLLHEARVDCGGMWWYVMNERQFCSAFTCSSCWACILCNAEVNDQGSASIHSCWVIKLSLDGWGYLWLMRLCLSPETPSCHWS